MVTSRNEGDKVPVDSMSGRRVGFLTSEKTPLLPWPHAVLGHRSPVSSGISFMGLHPHDLITPRRSHSQTPSHWVYVIWHKNCKRNKHWVPSLLLLTCYRAQKWKTPRYQVILHFLKDTQLSLLSISPNTTLYCFHCSTVILKPCSLIFFVKPYSNPFIYILFLFHGNLIVS